jgi:starch synthase
MFVLAHPTGAAHARLMAAALHDAGQLHRFYTGIDLGTLRPLLPILPSGLARELGRRMFNLPRERIAAFPWREGPVIVAERMPALARLLRTRHYREYTMYVAFDRNVARRLAREDARGFYGYIDSCRVAIEQARARGWHCVVEVTSPYRAFENAIFREEKALRPDWAVTVPNPFPDDGFHGTNEQREILAMADSIIVPSDFVAGTLPDAEQSKVLALPYGCGMPAAQPGTVTRSGPLRALFVGNLTQRKGLAYLSDALERTGDAVALSVIGRSDGAHCPPREALLQRARWTASLPNQDVRAAMRDHDVLVLPSISEAFGLVVTEALAQGTPVIVTDNVGAGEMITDGIHGFVVPIRDAGAIADRLLRLAHDRDLLMAMRRNALDLACAQPSTGLADAVVRKLAQRMDTARR